MNSANRPRRLLFLMVAAGLLAGAGLLRASLFPVGADAYTAHGFRWKTPVVGYSVGDARVQAYSDEAMRLWSEPSMLRAAPGGGDIRIVVDPLKEPIHYAGQPAQANVQHAGGWISSCEVRLDPVHYFNLEPGIRQAVLTHEVGHCMGLDHSKEPSIMQSPYLYTFGADDAEGMRGLYGPQRQFQLAFRAVLVGIASND